MLQDLLVNQRVNPKLISRMLSGVTYEAERSEPAERLLAARLSGFVGFDARICASKRIMAFVGPNGAGKTTLVAKLATRLRDVFQLQVGLLGCDSGQLGAGFHLKTFADLMGIPFRQLSRHEMRTNLGAAENAIQELSNCDIILLDSDGRTTLPPLLSHRTETLMVLPAPWRTEELVATALRYQASGYQRLVISKIDCCGFAGPLVEALFEIAKPLAFFSHGPRVPQDIEPASARRLAKMLTQILH